MRVHEPITDELGALIESLLPSYPARQQGGWPWFPFVPVVKMFDGG